MRTTGPVVLAAAILAQGCAPPYRVAPRAVHFSPDSPDDPYWAHASPRDPTTVATMEGDPARPHTKMGKITVESKGLDTNISLERLREEAGRRGLDAVIFVTVTKTSTGGSSNEAINYFFPPVVRHAIEGVGVLFKEPPSPSAPAPAPSHEPLPPPLAPPAQPIVETPPAEAAPTAELPPPSLAPSKHAPLPPPDTFTDERK